MGSLFRHVRHDHNATACVGLLLLDHASTAGYKNLTPLQWEVNEGELCEYTGEMNGYVL